MKKIKKSKFNWFGFKHSEVKKRFEGELSYCGTFCLKSNFAGEYIPWSVYHNAKPNRKKGHKDYMLLTLDYSTGEKKMWVSGRDDKEMEKERYQWGIYCPACKELIYSVTRHDFRTCKCGVCSIDGGKDYIKTSEEGILLKIDLLTGEEVLSNSVKFVSSLNNKGKKKCLK